MANDGASPRQLKQEMLDYLLAIKTRQQAFSFRIIAARLRANRMPTARGYNELLPKYEALPLANPSLGEYLIVIKALYLDSILYSRRAVAFYDVPEEQAARMPRALESLVDDGNQFAGKFPLPISPSMLRRAGYNGKFVRVSVHDGVIRAIACAKRSYRERKPIEVDLLDDDAKAALSDFDEVIGIKHGWVQGFDYVEFNPENRRLSVHLDICCPLGQDDFKQARMYYVQRINEACGVEQGADTSIVLPRNLFAYVQKFYDDSDGTVGRLGHATGTDSVKEERMRGRRKDLRQEPFHKKGLEEIKTTDSYAIRKSWPVESAQNSPTIELPGHFADAGDPDAAIYYAVFEQCSNEADYNMLAGKLA
ncbi:MAG: hypothetical protein EPN57_19185 [Paraburkholderia sp.]|nr:MAG: hypothetical protein EPN57_19185 [Paraburkholderia sp.]